MTKGIDELIEILQKSKSDRERKKAVEELSEKAGGAVKKFLGQ